MIAHIEIFQGNRWVQAASIQVFGKDLPASIVHESKKDDAPLRVRSPRV